MLPFHVLCPEIAAKEVRTLTVKRGALPGSNVPADTYGFLEFYCEEKDCDCRRVLLCVFSESGNCEVARISHAFEPPEDESLREFGQTYLEPYGKREPYAEDLVAVFKEVVLDDAYSARLREHYRIFKERLESGERIPKGPAAASGGAGMRSRRTTGPNEPCPCGSGRKYKKCCGRS